MFLGPQAGALQKVSVDDKPSVCWWQWWCGQQGAAFPNTSSPEMH